MIKAYFSFDDGLFHFTITKNNPYFTSIYLLLKEKYRCKYDEKTRSWTTKSATNSLAIYHDIKSYGEVDISEEDLELMSYLVYPDDSSFKKIKIAPDKELLEKFPPLVGKHPNENFQLEAIKKGLIQNKIIFDIEMGHGKSYIFAMVLGTLLKKGLIDRCLIICRLEGMENIRLELLSFLRDILVEDDIAIVDTSHREIEDFFDKKIIITNYITFRLTGKYYNNLRSKSKTEVKKPKKPTINFNKWGNSRLLLLDESQEINNYDSLQSHFIHLYKNYFNRIVDMSGSLGYKLIHYFSHTKLLLPETMNHSFTDWTNYISVKGNYISDYIITEYKEDKVKEFKEKVIDKLQISYRDCLTLPENLESIIYVRMNEKMKNIYRGFVSKEVNNIKKNTGEKVSGLSLENHFSTLTQVTSDPILIKEEYRKGWKFTDSPKLEVLKSLLEKYIDEEGQKVIVWSTHPKILNLLKDYFKKYNPLTIHGEEDTSVKKSERFKEAMKFQESANSNLALFSYVMSTSINMTKVTRQIYWDMPLDNDDFDQSKKRIHREGQKNKVRTDYLQYNNSVDVYIWEEILLPKKTVKGAISSKEELSLEDYANIFNRSKESYLTKTG